jgi:hypothetical protein
MQRCLHPWPVPDGEKPDGEKPNLDIVKYLAEEKTAYIYQYIISYIYILFIMSCIYIYVYIYILGIGGRDWVQG